MSIYLCTFISGLQHTANAVLSGFGVSKVLLMLDGAAIYRADSPVRAGCFNNVFEVLAQRDYSGAGALDKLLASCVTDDGRLRFSALATKTTRTFRLVCSRENKLASVNSQNKQALEKLIAQSTGLRLDRQMADVEFWLYSRSEGMAFFMRRLTYDRVTEKQLQHGELRPELCYFLNYLSEPTARDVFLDPFAGSGAIGLMRLGMGALAHMYALDIDPKKAVAVAARLSPKANGRLTAAASDISSIGEFVPDASVSRIVTDPPWGYYEQLDIDELHTVMLKSFALACKQNARIVILSAQKEAFTSTLSEFKTDFALERTYDILVSGKKAGVFVLTRR